MVSVMISPPAPSRFGARSSARTMPDLDGPSSSPLSSLSDSSLKCPEKTDSTDGASKSSGDEDPRKLPKITLRFVRAQPQAESTVDHQSSQSSMKMKRGDSTPPDSQHDLNQANTGPKPTTTRATGRKSKSTNLQETTFKHTKAKTTRSNLASTKATSTRNPTSKTRVNKKTTSPVKHSFSESAIASFALREMYNAIPSYSPRELETKWVSLQKRQEVFELAEGYVNSKLSVGKDYSKQLGHIKLDLNLWEDGISQVSKVRYPYFERVMEKMLFWIDRGITYKVEDTSEAKHEEAKAAKVAREGNAISEEDLFRDSEIRAALSELQAFEHDRMIANGDSTLHRLRAGILNAANRFCIEQSRVGLDCTKLLLHLKADLHLCPGDVNLMKEGKLATLSKQDIQAIVSQLHPWFRGEEIYKAGQRAVQMFDSWYEDYKAAHREMNKLGLYV